MRTGMLCVAIAAALWSLPGNAKERNLLDWNALVDAEAQEYEDPYRDLSPEQLNDLVTVVRMRTALERGPSSESARTRFEARLTEIEARFAATEIDIDWLIDQRWAVADRRQRAALAGNAALDGAEVEIAGFLIPAPEADDGTPTAYLVPVPGMCSHMPPPPPNQLLQLRLEQAADLQTLYTPAVVRGTLNLGETQRDMFLVDGPIQMWSVWTLETDETEIHGVARSVQPGSHAPTRQSMAPKRGEAQ